MKAKVIAYEEIVGIRSIEGLKALDSYYESPAFDLDENQNCYDMYESVLRFNPAIRDMRDPKMIITIF